MINEEPSRIDSTGFRATANCALGLLLKQNLIVLLKSQAIATFNLNSETFFLSVS
jgi:hypothetical protein